MHLGRGVGKGVHAGGGMIGRRVCVVWCGGDGKGGGEGNEEGRGRERSTQTHGPLHGAVGEKGGSRAIRILPATARCTGGRDKDKPRQ